MVWDSPAMVMVAERAAPSLDATLMVTSPLPVPPAADRVIQERLLGGMKVVQLHWL